MKCLNQMILMTFIAVLLLTKYASAAPDKFGNGGGVWSCEGSSSELFDMMFMDVFEARREYQLIVPETAGEHLAYVQEKKAWIQKNLPQGIQINKHIEYVEKNITWIDDIIVSIPDAANKITPHPSLCKQGEWKPVQLVNFTDDFRILIRRELFESPLLTNMERGAVYLHEGIYSFLRSEFNDSTSVRTRAIVGFVISDLSDSEKVQRINKVLGQEPVNPDPEEHGYVCGIRPGHVGHLYLGEKKTEAEARTAALEECIKGERIDFLFPGVGYGPERECIASKVGCEEIKTSEKKYSCSFKDFFGRKEFKGQGRTRLEAQKDSINSCYVNGEDEHTCSRLDSMTCH